MSFTVLRSFRCCELQQEPGCFLAEAVSSSYRFLRASQLPATAMKSMPCPTSSKAGADAVHQAERSRIATGCLLSRWFCHEPC